MSEPKVEQKPLSNSVLQMDCLEFGESTTYWAPQKNLVKGCRETLDCYCVSCELLSASIAEALLFVNMVCLPLIAEQNAHTNSKASAMEADNNSQLMQ